MEIQTCMKRNVFFISDQSTLRQAAVQFIEHHIGLLPVVDGEGKPVGAIRLADLLSLELPDFFNLLSDLDFVHDFGVLENRHPDPSLLDHPVTVLMQPVTLVEETCGLLRAYSLMLKHNLHDLPIVSSDGMLVGIASRVDIGTAILSGWLDADPLKP